ncbi:MAG: DegT/DnrJ/EryC1/StrS family aminotransferase [Ferruginibacter sp.]
MTIPFVDLKAQYLSIKEEIDAAISTVIDNTDFIGGKPVEQFEKDFAALYGVKHCISTANGTDSLYIVMKMLGIGAGDEVITSASSWISSSETISQTGATPVFVDIDPVFFTIDEEQLEKVITPKTRCIIPVHLYGQICNMDAIMNIADKHKLYVLEDCAQSHFSEFGGKRAGTIGIAGSFSFYPGKNLGAYGDAGCIITNDDELARKFRLYARHGAIKKHEHEIEGINSRLDGLQAGILSAKLPYIFTWTEKRIKVAALYDELLKNIKQITIPAVRPNSKHTFHLYVIRCEKRDELAAYLKQHNIATAIHYPTALPNLPAYRYLGKTRSDFPVATNYESQILSLPIFPELTNDQVVYITDTIKSFYKY